MKAAKKKLHAKDCQDISIWVDKYGDLFSDYDSRDFTERALSDDFIMEVRKLVRELPSEKIEIKFNLMEEPSNAETEAIIIKNIHEHFAYYADVVQKEMNQIFRNGCLMCAGGFGLIISLAFLGAVATESSFINGSHMALEPIGWFLAWTGLDMVFQQSKKEQETIDFNLKMTRSEITFMSFGISLDIPAEEAETTIAPQPKVIPCGNSLRVAS